MKSRNPLPLCAEADGCAGVAACGIRRDVLSLRLQAMARLLHASERTIKPTFWKVGQERAAWARLYRRRLPEGYHIASRDQVQLWFAPALGWTSAKHHGGLGLIGKSGAGKSCTLACLLWALEQPFLWWSGTEARDAAIHAATADKDREGARRRWEHAMTVPVLALDDVSQGKMTESWSSSLFDLLETRLGNRLPTVWSSEITLPEIRDKIICQNGGDTAQAEAISRRLGQHSLIVTV